MKIPVSSIKMVTCNRVNSLPWAIYSTIKQDIIGWELVIIDDGSTGNISGILARYYIGKIKIVVQKCNKGGTQKTSILITCQENVLQPLDSGDEMVPEALSIALTTVNAVGVGTQLVVARSKAPINSSVMSA